MSRFLWVQKVLERYFLVLLPPLSYYWDARGERSRGGLGG